MQLHFVTTRVMTRVGKSKLQVYIQSQRSAYNRSALYCITCYVSCIIHLY